MGSSVFRCQHTQGIPLREWRVVRDTRPVWGSGALDQGFADSFTGMVWSKVVVDWRLRQWLVALYWAVMFVLVVRAWWWIDRQMSMSGAYGRGSQLLTEQNCSCWWFVLSDGLIDRCRWVAFMVRVRSSLPSNTDRVGCSCTVMGWSTDVAKWRLLSGFAASYWTIQFVLVVRAWWWINRKKSQIGAYGRSF